MSGPDAAAVAGAPARKGLDRDSASRRPRPVLIGGCPRSGTTMLGALLGHGPDRLTVPEAPFKWRLAPGSPRATAVAPIHRDDVRRVLDGDWTFLLWAISADEAFPHGQRIASYQDVVTRLVRAHGREVGKPDPRVWVDHTPLNIKYATTLGRLLPDAKFVHIIRDGRGVAASVLPLDWGPNTVGAAARWWATHVAMGLAAEHALGPERIHTVRYEDLVRDGAATLRGVCAFLEVPPPSSMVATEYRVQPYTHAQHRLVSAPPDATRADAWRHELAPRAREEFEHITGDLLSSLGYPLEYGPEARPQPRPSRFGEAARALVVGQLRHRPHRWQRRFRVRLRARQAEADA